MLNKETNKSEILDLYEKYSSSEIVAEKLQEKYEIYDKSLSSLSRKIRKWIADYKNSGSVISKHTEKSPAKVLIFDIETSPLVAYTWSKWQQNINDDDIIKDWSILCFSAKWLFEEKVYSFKMTKEELAKLDDSRMATELWKMLDEADIVIAHNGQKFDIKKANTKFIQHRLNLPSSYQVIDTLLHARKKFSMTSNRLDFLGEYLKVGRKLDTPKGMWREIMNGNYDMLKKMSKYCDQDVRLLEEVYLEMRPYIQPHPNMGLYVTTDAHACTSCGSENISKTGKTYDTTVNRYDSMRCDDCGSLMRSKQSILTLKERKKTLSSLPQ